MVDNVEITALGLKNSFAFPLWYWLVLILNLILKMINGIYGGCLGPC